MKGGRKVIQKNETHNIVSPPSAQGVSDYKEAKNLYGLKKYYQSILFFEKAQEEFENDSDFLQSFAKAYRRAERFQDAIRVYKKISGWKMLPFVVKSLAICYSEIGENKKALKIIKHISNWETDFACQLVVAACKSRDGQFIEATQIYTSFKDGKYCLPVMKGFLRACMEHGLYDKAIELAHIYLNAPRGRRLNLFPIRMIVARCYEAQGKYKKAIKSYKNALRQKDSDSPKLGVARCKMKLGQYVEAIEEFQKVPDYDDYQKDLWCFGECYQAMNDLANALAIFKKAHASDENAYMLRVRAECNFKLRNFKKTLELYQKIPTLPANREVILGMGRCCVELNNYHQAQAIIQTYPDWKIDDELLALMKECISKIKEFDNAAACDELRMIVAGAKIQDRSKIIIQDDPNIVASEALQTFPRILSIGSEPEFTGEEGLGKEIFIDFNCSIVELLDVLLTDSSSETVTEVFDKKPSFLPQFDKLDLQDQVPGEACAQSSMSAFQYGLDLDVPLSGSKWTGRF